ncbi:hypothetical protein FA95DRAFT_1575818 [Auriscalpium vulgare]|uniref:Uncharacterized protein n=1 Tax=Auriscalpium vulgare TaxID=40419 RepID=A0ACB8RFB6_9AGAM|nr:hypothetical protein FA95DRAFT_1575818 [Auriscalpium vulgare]
MARSLERSAGGFVARREQSRQAREADIRNADPRACEVPNEGGPSAARFTLSFALARLVHPRALIMQIRKSLTDGDKIQERGSAEATERAGHAVLSVQEPVPNSVGLLTGTGSSASHYSLLSPLPGLQCLSADANDTYEEAILSSISLARLDAILAPPDAPWAATGERARAYLLSQQRTSEAVDGNVRDGHGVGDERADTRDVGTQTDQVCAADAEAHVCAVADSPHDGRLQTDHSSAASADINARGAPDTLRTREEEQASPAARVEARRPATEQDAVEGTCGCSFGVKTIFRWAAALHTPRVRVTKRDLEVAAWDAKCFFLRVRYGCRLGCQYEIQLREGRPIAQPIARAQV